VELDAWERLPLHYAVLAHAPLAVVEPLLAAHPLAAVARDDMGKDTPLDLAYQKGASPEVLAALEVAAAAAPPEERLPDAERRGSNSLALARARAASLSRGARAAASLGREHMHRRRSSSPAVDSRSTKMGATMTSAVNDLVNFEELKPMRAWWKLLMKVPLRSLTLTLTTDPTPDPTPNP